VTLGTTGIPNPPFQGFPSNSQAASFCGQTNSWVTVTNLPVNSANISIVAWIYPTNANALGTILWNNSSSGLGEYPFNTTELGYNWNGDGNTWSYQPGLFPPLNQWSMVALVITPTQAVFYMNNTNGQYCAINSEPNAAGDLTTACVIGGVGSSQPASSFNGSLANVAIFNYSLDSSRLEQLYYDAVTGTSPEDLSAANPTNIVISTKGNVSSCLGLQTIVAGLRNPIVSVCSTAIRGPTSQIHRTGRI
jgi:Concanavalin A-like lectin/glucanases superfamily